MKRKYIVAGVAVVVLGGVGFLLVADRAGDTSPLQAGHVTRVVKVTRGNLDLTVSANGVVQPIDRVEIKSKASGQIEIMNFEEGQTVQKGTLLIELDRTTARNDFDQAKADLAVAESNLRQQQNNYNRALELFSKSLISEQERDQVTLEKVRAEAQLVKAKAVLSSADERLRDTRIVSPITGVILTRNVALGQIISSGVTNVSGGTLLATIADMNEVHVETNVDEVDIGRVEVGQRARAIADAYPEEEFVGRVIRIAPLGKTQQNVTTFSVVILVRNLGGKLKAGMSASVDVEIFNKSDVLLIPTEALKDPRSEQGKALLATVREQDMSEKASAAASPGDAQAPTPAEMRERIARLPPEEQQGAREEMRRRIQNMSDDERQKYFAAMRQQFGGGQGGVRGRRAQTSQGSAKERIVEVKEGNDFIPKLVKIGVGNYDFSEVLEGLQEGDEIQITTVSRAKLASQQFSERIRASQSLGGVSGGAARAASGTGGRR
ncbi:MAG: efflux RND transporter periplasmic adaptor subunit [Ignavibacteriales bacterium]|nr:efflux RND transporter periplasmic adaptor subunit [Ignavibacteriales bacterium]